MLSALWSFVWTADFAGLLCGVAGTLLLATKGRWAGWGFVAFLASNIGWILFAWDREIPKLLIQHLIFAGSSLVGVWVWLLKGLLQQQAFGDTECMEEDIWRRFNGRNAADLASAWGLHTWEVYEIVTARHQVEHA